MILLLLPVLGLEELFFLRRILLPELFLCLDFFLGFFHQFFYFGRLDPSVFHQFLKRKARNLAVVQVRKDDNLLLVRGAIPGPVGGVVVIKKALKKG